MTWGNTELRVTGFVYVPRTSLEDAGVTPSDQASWRTFQLADVDPFNRS